MLSKLEPAIALLDKYEKEYDVVYTNFVGTIVYEDNWQVAAERLPFHYKKEIDKHLSICLNVCITIK